MRANKKKKHIVLVNSGQNRDGINFLHEMTQEISDKITECNQIDQLKITKVLTSAEADADILICDLDGLKQLTKND